MYHWLPRAKSPLELGERIFISTYYPGWNKPEVRAAQYFGPDSIGGERRTWVAMGRTYYTYYASATAAEPLGE